MSKLMEKLDQKESEKNKIQYWRPEEGEVIEGTVTEMGETITENGDAEYLQIETQDHAMFMVFVNSVLKTLLEEEKVRVGDMIAIKFLGKKKSKKKGWFYKSYVLAKESDSEDSDSDSDSNNGSSNGSS